MPQDKFHELPKLLFEAFENKDHIKVKAMVMEYLNLAAQNKTDWNYGNAIHQANIYLGLIAIDNNEIDNAKNYLIYASLTPGSPQLKSFGPNMLLAKKLLEIGETEIVLEYIELCKKFWKFPFGFLYPIIWRQKIKKGAIPDFKGNLYYHLGFVQNK